MAKKKARKKPLTLRQQLRLDAEKKLEELVKEMRAAAIAVAGKEAIDPFDLMKYIAVDHNKTIHARLVTDLANGAEAELLRIYNNQQALPLDDEEKDIDD